MREIKFRIWNKEDCKMVYSENDLSSFFFSHKNWKDRKTMCQYTGLKDKNGVEIYEGDIVVTDDIYGRIITVVFWNQSCCCFDLDEHDHYVHWNSYNLYDFEWEVIGQSLWHKE